MGEEKKGEKNPATYSKILKTFNKIKRLLRRLLPV
jgi:hypothetical protein